MPDTLLAGALVAVALLLAFHARSTPSGLLPRFIAGRRYHRQGRARHCAKPADSATVPISAVVTIPDGGPFAMRTT